MVSIKFQLKLMKGIGFGFDIQDGMLTIYFLVFFFFQAEDGIRDISV